MNIRSFLFLLALPSAALASAQASFTDGTYVQNFDTLASDGFSVEFDAASPIPGTDGWYAKPGPAELVSLFVADGSGENSGLYSVGSTGSTERALGSKSGNSGTLFGLALRNNTGATLTSLDLSFYGELWRDAQANGTTPNTNRLFVGYRIGGATLLEGGFTSLPTFDLFSGLGVPEAQQPLDGNANRTLKSGTVSGFSLVPNETFWLSFRGQSYPRDEAMFGIDDVRVIATQPVPEPATVAALGLGAAALLRRRRKSA